jgi:hypothetical protein
MPRKCCRGSEHCGFHFPLLLAAAVPFGNPEPPPRRLIQILPDCHLQLQCTCKR